MEGLLVSAATGALKSVLEKLATLMGDEYKRFKGVRREVQSLNDELSAIHAFLLKLSEEENPDVQDKIWMKEVRELSYDIEDSLDDFMLLTDDRSASPDGFMNKIKNLLTKAKARRRIAKAIEDLKAQIMEVADRNKRYMSRETIVKSTNATVDRRALSIFEDASKLVGITGPKNEVIELLGKEDVLVTSQQPKVVSIVGLGGLGKTTLANQLYEELKQQFECEAFVSVSRNPDMVNVLTNILCQLSDQPYPNIKEWSLQLLIGKISKFLSNKRYLIIIDDIWTKDTWDIINYALFKNTKNSIIITTTRMHDVAKACCSSHGALVYKMRPLAPFDSKKLFVERIFGTMDKCPAHLMQVSDRILKKCDGLPLAIISISGLLANKPQTRDQWDLVQKSIGRGIGKDTDVETMMQILSISYYDLPHHLKTCLLYLSMFPEDSIIGKRRLVRRWSAEGFIHVEKGYTLYELGELCFNELINRSLIQARNINKYGEVTACQVHDIILDFILLKSEELNFASVFCNNGHQILADNKVRRLSMHARMKDNHSVPSELDLSHVRSLQFRYSGMLDLSADLANFKSILLADLADFSFLRVLDLQGCTLLNSHHLGNIWNLFQLKYLSLCETSVCYLEEQICNLQYLETLNLRNSGVRRLPARIIQLRRLAHLVVDKGVKLPNGTGGMTALENLECIDVFHQPIEVTREIGQLANLRSVTFFLNSEIVEGCSYKDYTDNIISSLCKLGHLRSLSFDIHARSYYLKESNMVEDFTLDSGGYVPLSLQKFNIRGGFISKVPKWVKYLVNLQLLALNVKEFESDDIMVLGRLPALVFLQLVAHESFEGRRVAIRDSDGFQCLRKFDFRCAIPVIFEVGAMPKLENLTLKFSSSAVKNNLVAGHGHFPFGIQHLCSLDSINCFVYWSKKAIESWIKEKKTEIAGMIGSEKDMVTISKVKATITQEDPRTSVTCVIKTAVRAHPRSPKFELSHTGRWMNDDQSANYARQSIRNQFEHAKRDVLKQVVEWVLKYRNLEVAGNVKGYGCSSKKLLMRE